MNVTNNTHTVWQHLAPWQLLGRVQQSVRCYIPHCQEACLGRWQGLIGPWIAPLGQQWSLRFLSILDLVFEGLVPTCLELALDSYYETKREKGGFWQNGSWDVLTAASISSSTAVIPSEPLRDIVPDAINKSWFLIAWPCNSWRQEKDEVTVKMTSSA